MLSRPLSRLPLITRQLAHPVTGLTGRQFSRYVGRHTDLILPVIGMGSMIGILGNIIYYKVTEEDDPQKVATDEIIKVCKSGSYSGYYDEKEIKAITKNIFVSINDLPCKYITNSLIIMLVKTGGARPSTIPLHHWNEELALDIIKFFGNKAWDIFNIIPEEFRTEKVCKLAIDIVDSGRIWTILRDITQPYTDLFLDVLNKDYHYIVNIRKEFQTKEMWDYVFNQDHTMIKRMPAKFQTEDMMLIAVKEDPNLIEYCHEPSLKVCSTAYLSDINIIDKIKGFKNKYTLLHSQPKELERIISQ